MAIIKLYVFAENDVDGHQVVGRTAAAADQHVAERHDPVVTLRRGALGDERRDDPCFEHLTVAGDDVVADELHPVAARSAEVVGKNIASRIEGDGPGDTGVPAEQLVEHAAVVSLVVEPERNPEQAAAEPCAAEVVAETRLAVAALVGPTVAAVDDTATSIASALCPLST